MAFAVEADLLRIEARLQTEELRRIDLSIWYLEEEQLNLASKEARA